MLINNERRNTVPEWASFFSFEQYAEFSRQVSDYFADGSVIASFREGALLNGHNAKMGLLNIAQLCRMRPVAEWKNLLRQHFEGLLQAAEHEQEFSGKSHNLDYVKEYIGVRIYPREYIEAIRDGLIIGRPLAEGIYAMVVFDFPDSVVGIRPEQTIQWNLTNQEIFDLGLNNIRKKYPVKLIPQLLEGIDFHVAVEDHYFAPNILFDLEKLEMVHSEHGVLIGVPNRHAVLVHPVKDIKVMRAINRMIPAIYGMYQDGPGSISDRLYWLRNGEFVSLPYRVESENILLDPPAVFMNVLASFGNEQSKSEHRFE